MPSHRPNHRTPVGPGGAGRWAVFAGYLLYVAVLSAGYYYNLTFVQLGIIDLRTRLVGLAPARVSAVDGRGSQWQLSWWP